MRELMILVEDDEGALVVVLAEELEAEVETEVKTEVETEVDGAALEVE